MTVRLKVPYGTYKPNDLLTTGAAIEAELLRTGQADTGTGVAHTEPDIAVSSVPASVVTSAAGDSLMADGRSFRLLTPAQVSSVQAIGGITTRTVYVDAAYAVGGASSSSFTTYHQNLIDAESARFDATGFRTRVVYPNSTWMLGDRHYWKANVWYDFGESTFTQSLTAGNPGAPMFMCVRTNVAGTYYGRHNNIKITGGTAISNGYGGGAHVVEMTEFVDAEINGFSVRHTTGRNNWAWYLTGRNIRVTDPRVLNGAAVFQDGLHFSQGRGLTVINGRLDAGDDAFVIGNDITSSDPLYQIDDEGISNVVVIGTQVNALRGYGVSVYYGQDFVAAGGTFRRTIREVTMTNITGTAGQLANGGVRVIDTSAAGAPAIDNSTMSGVTIQAKLAVGSTSHDGTNSQGVIVRGGTDIEIDASITYTDNTMTVDATHTRFYSALINNVSGLKLRLRQKGLVGNGLTITPYSATHTIADWRLVDCDIYCPATTGTGGVELNNQVQGLMTKGGIYGGYIRGVQNGSYGILAQAGAATAGVLNLEQVTFYKAAGAATTYGYQAATAAAVAHCNMHGCNFDDLTSGSPGNQFAANHTSYLVNDNRNFVSKQAGVATIAAAATSVAVNIITTAVRFSDLTLTASSQVRVWQTNFSTVPIKFTVTLTATTVFTITSDAMPGASTATFAWSLDVSKKPL